MSVLLGQHVKNVLMASDEVTDIAGDAIYPAVAIQGTPHFPFVRFTTEVIGADYLKGGEGIDHVEDHCTVTVNCVSDNYDEAVLLQAAVREALECLGGEYDTYTLDPMEVNHADCIFNMDLKAFDAQIDFSCNTQKVVSDDEEVEDETE